MNGLAAVTGGVPWDLVGATERFSEMVNRVPEDVRLDEAALLIAAHAYPHLNVDLELDRLDALAAGVGVNADLESWRHHMFVELGFGGKPGHYYDPENSYLNDVVRRRIGLPIALSVVGIELARRMGLPLVGVGMPGHFLLRSATDPSKFVDPFDRGRVLDPEGCRERFHAVNGVAAPFVDSHLDPVGPQAILARMLANLKAIFAHNGDVDGLAWVLTLRLAIPGVPLLERRDRARLRASAGRYVEAADELEDLASALPDMADALDSEALALRARLN